MAATQEAASKNDNPPPSDLPAEENRLSTAVFRAGLQRRGLTELLELHLKEFPPQNETEALLMRRGIRRADYADQNLPPDERMAALNESNRILEQVLERDPGHPQRFEWGLELAHSLLYEQAERYLTPILYHGGSEADREGLMPIAERAIHALRAVQDDLAAEYARIDRMSIEEFEQVDGDGHVDMLDRVGPRAEYLLVWALCYDSLARAPSDSTREAQLHEIIEVLDGQRAFVETPHETSHVQVQALLLKGMTLRLMGRHDEARTLFNRAIVVADGIQDAQERARVAWAVAVARLERIRNDRDAGQFDEARDGISRMRDRLQREDRQNFGLRLAAALLERSLYEAMARDAERTGVDVDAQRWRREAWRCMARLSHEHPDERDAIYAAVFDKIRPGAGAAALDPFEQCALIADLLHEADRAGADANDLLDRAIAVGETFVRDHAAGAPSLSPEVLYNMAVAEYRRGRWIDAATRFLRVARAHREHDIAPTAASLAAQLASQLYTDAETQQDREDVRQLYREALTTLVEQYESSEAAQYWRFFLAQLLESDGAYESAALHYGRVRPDHDFYLESLAFRARCYARALHVAADQDPPDRVRVQQLLEVFTAAHRAFVGTCTEALGRVRAGQNETGEATSLLGAETERASRPANLLGQAQLVAAEVYALPAVDQPNRALELVGEFEQRFPQLADVGGRVWRVRLIAYERLGRLDEAAQAIPAYIAADPHNAGATLQSLYLALAEESDRLAAAGDIRLAQKKAETALVLAQQIHQWATSSVADQSGEAAVEPDARNSQRPAAADRRLIVVQLAEANLRAGQYTEAHRLFESVRNSGAGTGVERSMSAEKVRVDAGLAETLFQLERYADALELFNQLATRLPPGDPVRWQALLRDLQCRTELHHPPEGVIQVIEQQRYLFPDLGGPRFAGALDKLLRENQRRRDEH